MKCSSTPSPAAASTWPTLTRRSACSALHLHALLSTPHALLCPHALLTPRSPACACPALQLQYLYASLGQRGGAAAWRGALASLKADYEQHYKYTGKV